MTTPEETFDALLRRQADERQALADALIRVEQLEAQQLQQGFNANAGSALAEALRELERQLRQDARNGVPIQATVVDTLPGWAPAHLPTLDEEDEADGKKPVIVFMPRTDAHTGERERLALALFDVSAAVFGPSGLR